MTAIGILAILVGAFGLLDARGPSQYGGPGPINWASLLSSLALIAYGALVIAGGDV